jgi:uncharacterized membrane protein YdjX (TVP38/TMEM64 family)
MNRTTRHTKSGRTVPKLVVVATIAALAAAAAFIYDPQALLRETLLRVESSGPAGLILFFLLYVLATVLMVPGTILTLGAGMVFGVVKGSVLVSLSSTAGAVAAFVVGRHLVRERIAAKVEARTAFRAMDEAVSREGWKIVGLARLSPVFPFNLLNYAFSLTRISLRDYTLASWVGMIPGTVLYVYIGSLAGSLAQLGPGGMQRERSGAEWVFYIVGLAATAAVTVMITRIARRALKARMPSDKKTGESSGN